MVDKEKIEESELLGHDRHYVAEIWSELNIKGKALRLDIRDAGLYNGHFRKLRKFEELLGLIMKYWGPKPKKKKIFKRLWIMFKHSLSSVRKVDKIKRRPNSNEPK